MQLRPGIRTPSNRFNNKSLSELVDLFREGCPESHLNYHCVQHNQSLFPIPNITKQHNCAFQHIGYTEMVPVFLMLQYCFNINMLSHLILHKIDQRREAGMTSFCSTPNNYLIVLAIFFCPKLDRTC